MVTKLSMDCRKNTNCSIMCVCCTSVMTGSHTEAWIDCLLDKIALLVQLMEILANSHATSLITTTQEWVSHE